MSKSEVTFGQVWWWPIHGICALHLTHPSALHTHSSENTHTPSAVGNQCCGARGAVGGSVPCSRVSPQSWYWRRRERWLFTPPTDNSCRTWDSNPRPSGYKSDSLSIRPWLPQSWLFYIYKKGVFKSQYAHMSQMEEKLRLRKSKCKESLKG